MTCHLLGNQIHTKWDESSSRWGVYLLLDDGILYSLLLLLLLKTVEEPCTFLNSVFVHWAKRNAHLNQDDKWQVHFVHYVLYAPIIILPRSPLPERSLSAAAAVALRYGWVLGLDRAEYLCRTKTKGTCTVELDRTAAFGRSIVSSQPFLSSKSEKGNQSTM